MSSVESGSTKVLKAFIAGANAQYREAGLGEYQMRVTKDGTVTVPDRPSPAEAAAKAAAREGSPAASQANAGPAQSGQAAPGTGATGAAGATGATSGAAAGAAATTKGTAPALANVERSGTESIKLTWQPVQGAAAYGIWQDGQLIGSVTNPAFAAKIAASATTVLEIDAVLAGGVRTPRTPAVQLSRAGSAAVEAKVASANAGSAPPAGAPAEATAPAAAAG